MIVTVTNIDTSKNGKTRIFFNGRGNWQDAHYLGSRCVAPGLGMTIDADVSGKDFRNDGKMTYFLNSWKPAPAANGAAQQMSQITQIRPGSDSGQIGSVNMQGPQPGYIPPKPPSGWDIPTGDLSRFVSNVIGSAIAANLIKTPSDIAQWVGASYRAAESLRSGDVPEFDSDVPRFVEPDAAERQGFEEGDPGFDSDAPPF
jgi:hypothetical protein